MQTLCPSSLASQGTERLLRSARDLIGMPPRDSPRSRCHHHGVLQVVKGADVVQVIERTKTDRFDKPVEDIKIINIETRTSVE